MGQSRLPGVPPATAALGPRLYASDRQAGMVVLEDLGAPRTVQEALYGTDREAATAALVASGSCLAQLHGLTYGQRARVPGTPDRP